MSLGEPNNPDVENVEMDDIFEEAGIPEDKPVVESAEVDTNISEEDLDDGINEEVGFLSGVRQITMTWPTAQKNAPPTTRANGR